MRRYLGLFCFAVLAVSAAVAQQKKAVPPPPKPKDEGPSLEVTMKFIQDKLNDLGGVSFMTFANQTTDNTTFSHRWTFELSKVVADPADCSIRYHEKLTLDGKSVGNDGKSANEVDITVPLAAAENIQVEPFEQFENKDYVLQGHPEWVATAT
jgi:hypothetical protein